MHFELTKAAILLISFLTFTSAIGNTLFLTHFHESPFIVLIYPNESLSTQVAHMLQEYENAGDFSRPAIDGFLERFRVRFPGSWYDRNVIISQRSSDTITISSVCSNPFISSELDSYLPNNLNQWNDFITSRTLPINVRRSFIVEDAVKAYKDLDHITNPNHLFNRNIKVTFVDEAGVDQGGLRNEFFSIFFREVIENSGLFALNSEGYIIVATGRTFLKDFDIYEAFGFYLAKAFQNKIPVGCQFADIIIDMIKYGAISFTNLDLLQSWDPKLASGLRSLEGLSSTDLSSFNFDDLDSDFPSIQLTRDNVRIFNMIQFQNEINSKFRNQLVMIVLGFTRACPAHLLAKSNVNLSAAFIGNKAITAEELISAFSIEGPLTSVLTYNCFNKWLRSLNQAQIMKFFRFLTGMKVIPLGDLSNLSLKLSFLTEGTEHLLPQANTCQRTFILPPYQTEKQAKERLDALLQQIESGEAFGFCFA